MTSAIHRRTHCRLCDSPNLELAVPINASPIADAFVPAARLGQPQDIYPLDLYLCGNCGHVQNVDIVDPETLFRDYLFTTASSRGLVEHFSKYATSVVSDFNIQEGSLVVEVGSNDGTLLQFFKTRNMRVLGVDPALEIAKQAAQNGIETLPDFFNFGLAKQIRKEYGGASVCCANNVFAHADDLADVVRGIHELLSDEGVFVFEVSYLVDIVDGFLFDTVYHEHVSYHSIQPLAMFFERMDMQLIDVQRIASKGGSIRGFAQKFPEGKRKVQPIVDEMIANEQNRGFNRLAVYKNYAMEIYHRKIALTNLLHDEIRKGKMIAGYGASTTTTTLMWHFELTRALAFVVDDNPAKQGLYCPASHIPVMPSEELYIRQPDWVVILAWQYANPIINRHQRFMAEGGKFIIPLADLTILPA